ncbi:protein methyltransferase RmtC [Paecilomyces variotii]|uniref:Protein methyltransferase RmtC n=1 Tax=Byssochlamys spectabilis TaxID=264951 RepID=A0A443I1P4_BYSSP|nr:protein methyltransferase RmtC [Paecilomyces variotii]KAJ9362209.1 hypothetical protein DTO280E4_3459 [Paecilomyces variotii]RWQ97966.1 protein methyltransferase RmtC [Paecilomyces variotii]
MASTAGSEDMIFSFCVGQHESKRSLPVTAELVQRAHESNYDMLTTPVTTPHFHSRVLTLLSSHLSNSQPPSYDVSGTFETSQNTRPLTVPPLSAVDTPLTPNDSISQLMGVTSTWIDLCSPDPLIADISRQILMLEVAYAAFCGIGYLVIPGPKLHHGTLHSEGLIYYARAVQEALNLAPYIQFHIWMKMTDNSDHEVDEIGDLAPFAREEFLQDLDEGRVPKADPFGTWDAWEVIRRICKYHTRLFVALSLPRHLPALHVQSRWHCEPVHLLTINATSFIKNQKGYPVLSKAHQALIAKFMRLRTPPWILLCDVGPIPGSDGVDAEDSQTATEPSISASSNYPTLAQSVAQSKKHHDPTPHLSYIRNLQQRQPPRTPIERFGIGYQDYLQAPLQPLTVNLESITYEVFEKDPIKYEWYEQAIAKALRDWVDQKKPTSSPDGRVVVAVVGAGRGPLVTRALRASAETGVSVEVWAVEKNQNAFVLLQRHNENIWGGEVKLVKSDMRSWKGPCRELPPKNPRESYIGQAISPDSSTLQVSETSNKEQQPTAPANPPASVLTHTPIDILVSELLGSFGDNELSPECLDGVTHLLNPVHGISIPASYTAHLTPISAPKLHADITAQTVSNPAAPETPYVVMLHAIDYLSTTPPAVSVVSPPPTSSGGGAGNGPKDSSGSRSATSTPPPVIEGTTPIVQTAWSFSHPNHNISPPSQGSSILSNAHNVRQTRLTFPCQNRGVCHGLGGYFETVLYRDVELSTNPVTMDAKSSGMISWFPIFFPLKTPLYVPDNGQIVVTMYRQTDDRKVWYEWMVEVFALERIAAPASPTGYTSPVMTGARMASPGPDSARFKSKDQLRKEGWRRVRVGMSDLHSSIKEACLM